MCADINRHLSSAELRTEPVRGLALYFKETGTVKGRGVFAARRFAPGDLVEVAPVIVFNSRCSLPRDLANTLYNWEQQTGEPHTRAIALGYGSLYNHDNPANLRYEVSAPDRVIRYLAVRAIAAHEELTINYNAAVGRCSKLEDTWFERHGVPRWIPTGE